MSPGRPSQRPEVEATMILLSVDSLVKHYGPDPVLSGVTFQVRGGERIGLVGPNGSGKTTLLRILAGRQQADKGTVQLHRSTTVGYLEQQPTFAAEQTVWNVAASALEETIQMAAEAEEVAAAMSQTSDLTQRSALGRRFDLLQQELHRRAGYHWEHKVERVLEGLGFAPSAFGQPARQLSGGQQNRLLLAQLLLAEPDLMLMDEPSNHLDIEATEWLEAWLVRTNKALLVVSHDRYFLDKVTVRTLELVGGNVDSFAGNFSAYWRQKAERLEVQRRTYRKQQEEIAKLKDFVRRNQYGQKHAQAEDRKKKLERIRPVPPPREIPFIPMGFPPSARSGDVVVRAEHLAKGYDHTLFEDLSFEIQRGQRWAILGANGTGKTTLVRLLLGLEQPDAGQVHIGAGVQPAYFDQQLECLDLARELVESIRPEQKELNEQERRDLLARFGLKGDMAQQPVGSLSGGERNRAALARLAASGANFLVLDEPTNHLDMWASVALEKSLQQFDGTVLMVSHDRYFINRIADYLLVAEPGRFRQIDGNYDTYVDLVEKGLAGSAVCHEKNSDGHQKTPPKRKGNARVAHGALPAERKRRFPFRKLDDLEAEIAQREANLEELHAQLTQSDVLRDGQRVKQIKQEVETHRHALTGLYEHWEEAAELN